MRLIAGIFSVMTSLVLGLMINSAKNTLESVDRNIHTFAAGLIVLDRALAEDGPDAKAARERLLAYTLALLAFIASDGILAGEPIRPPVRYLIPDGYGGRLRIDYGLNAAHSPGYGVERALPLPVRDGMVVAEFPASGHLVTSSEMASGSAADQYFYSARGKLTPLSQRRAARWYGTSSTADWPAPRRRPRFSSLAAKPSI